MKNIKNTGVLIALSFFTFFNAFSEDTIPASDPLIEYTGRIDFADINAPRFSYSGISLRASFNGTSIAVILDDNIGQNYYNVILDGRLRDTMHITTGKKEYLIADGLENTTHEIELFKRTEEMFGKTQFFGFIVDEGTTLTSITRVKDKLIEYIGNSITCGYGNEGLNGGTFGPTTENHYMTYAAITSRNFNARHLAVCKSGIGIYRNYDGPAEGNSDCMTNYYTRIFLYDENPKYTFSEKPDLVCINLGTNDFSTTGGDSALYVSNYLRLIDTIQTKYAMPDILCLLGPMMSGSTLTSVRNYLTFVADSANSKGKGNVYFLEMSAQTGDLGIGIDYHPTVEQHQKNASELTEYIKSIKGWKINPLVINANLNETRHIQLEFNTDVIDTINHYGGFTVYGNDEEYTIDSIYRDHNDNNIMHILFQQSMDIGDNINLSYTPGNIESEDSVAVGAINYFSVKNNLTATIVSSGRTNSDGSQVVLTFNKDVKKNSEIEGLTLSGKNLGIINIDSFNIHNQQIALFLTDPVWASDTIIAGYTGTGIYGIDEIPLTQFEDMLIHNNSTLSVITELKVNAIRIFPNPNNSGILYYQLDESLNSRKEGTYEIIRIDGKTVLKGLISESSGQIDVVGNVSEGTYFLKIVYGDHVMTQPFILK